MYSIRYVSQKTGMSAHTLRYYEKEGLIGAIGRSGCGFRQYTDADLEALGLICCLKNTGMSLREIADFVALARQGDQTLAQRVDMLRRHRDNVVQRMSDMQKHLDKVTRKLNQYTDRLAAYEAGKDGAE